VEDTVSIMAALADPFPADVIEWKPQTVKGDRALAVAYVDARAIMDRLDAVLGIGGWQTHYREMGAGVVCTLRIRVAGEWSEHEDAGNYSDQPDDGDKLKAAFSDALKRAAVHVGIGRYLYRLPLQWAGYDPQKKRFAATPQLPAWALPGKRPAKAAASKLPANGAELRRRLLDYGDKLVQQGLCTQGQLLAFVLSQGVQAGYAADIVAWPGEAIAASGPWAKEFEAACRAKQAPASKPPVQAPAPAQPAAREPGDPDPAELIGPPEERRLQSLMKDAGKVWGKLIEWLNRKVNAGLPATTKIRDISFGHYWLMEKRLLQSIEEAKTQPQKQGAA
jgi:hypothetical protein